MRTTVSTTTWSCQRASARSCRSYQRRSQSQRFRYRMPGWRLRSVRDLRFFFPSSFGPHKARSKSGRNQKHRPVLDGGFVRVARARDEVSGGHGGHPRGLFLDFARFGVSCARPWRFPRPSEAGGVFQADLENAPSLARRAAQKKYALRSTVGRSTCAGVSAPSRDESSGTRGALVALRFPTFGRCAARFFFSFPVLATTLC